MLTRVLIILWLLTSTAIAQEQTSQDQLCLTIANVANEMSRRADAAKMQVLSLQQQISKLAADFATAQARVKELEHLEKK